jgi:hypothetical protein
MLTILEKPDIVETLLNEAVELKKRGRYFWALCPLHPDKIPSFKIDPNKQLFYCFGCNEHGDVVDLIQKYRGLSFKDALSYLGISKKQFKPTKEMLEKQKSRELVKAFREWGNAFHDRVATFYRAVHRVMPLLKTIEEVESMAWYYHRIPLWEHWLDILESNDDEVKFNLYKEYLEAQGCLI